LNIKVNDIKGHLYVCITCSGAPGIFVWGYKPNEIEIAQKLKQLADIVYILLTAKTTNFRKFHTIHLVNLDQYTVGAKQNFWGA